jgi:hypothetical protein
LPAALALAAASDYDSVKRKFDSIDGDRLKAGTRVELAARELNAYAEHEMPAGVRNPQLQVTAPEIATGSALVDFGKLRRSLGYQPNWLMSKLLDGERPVSVTARIRSSGGQATVQVQSVQISGLRIDGATLDFLIHNVLLPLYPDAVVDRPFDLGHRIEKLDVQPRGVGVVIGK